MPGCSSRAQSHLPSHVGHRAKSDLLPRAQLFSEQQLEEAPHGVQRPEPHCFKTTVAVSQQLSPRQWDVTMWLRNKQNKLNIDSTIWSSSENCTSSAAQLKLYWAVISLILQQETKEPNFRHQHVRLWFQKHKFTSIQQPFSIKITRSHYCS